MEKKDVLIGFLDHSQDGHILTNSKGEIIYWNPAMELISEVFFKRYAREKY